MVWIRRDGEPSVEFFPLFVREDTAGEFVKVEVSSELVAACDEADDPRDVDDVCADV